MSYDIRLKDPVTDETLDLPLKHVMTGGTYQADYDEQTSYKRNRTSRTEARLSGERKDGSFRNNYLF